MERSGEVLNVGFALGVGGSGPLWLLGSGQLLLLGSVVAPTAAQVGGGGLEAWEMCTASCNRCRRSSRLLSYSFPTPGLKEDRLSWAPPEIMSNVWQSGLGRQNPNQELGAN